MTLTTAPDKKKNKVFRTVVDMANTAFNLVSPIPGLEFIIEGFSVFLNSPPPNPATVTIYEAPSAVSLVEDEVFLDRHFDDSTGLSLTNLKLGIDEGKFLNVKSTNTDLFVVILGFFRLK